jgi:hypothetical protein
MPLGGRRPGRGPGLPQPPATGSAAPRTSPATIPTRRPTGRHRPRRSPCPTPPHNRPQHEPPDPSQRRSQPLPTSTAGASQVTRRRLAPAADRSVPCRTENGADDMHPGRAQPGRLGRCSPPRGRGRSSPARGLVPPYGRPHHRADQSIPESRGLAGDPTGGNHDSFAGNLTDDPGLRHTESGIARAVFRVAPATVPLVPVAHCERDDLVVGSLPIRADWRSRGPP